MGLLNHVVALAVLGLLAVAPGDGPAGSGRAAVGPAAARPPNRGKSSA